MRRFRFVGDPSEHSYFKPLEKDGVYPDNYFVDSNGGILISEVNYKRNLWQEVFDNDGGTILTTCKPLHKDTDLGYFTIEIIKSIIKIAPLQKPNPEATNEFFCKDCISLAKELIKQLNEETK